MTAGRFPTTPLPPLYRQILALVLAAAGTANLWADDPGVPLPIPSITFTSSTFSGSYPSAFLFDGNPTVGSDSSLGGQWAGRGVGPIHVDLDFGITVTTDCFGYAQRQGGNPSLDKTIKFELFFSDTPGTFQPSPDVTIDSGINTANDDFTLYPLGANHSGRHLRFRVTGNGGNVGGSELRFYQAAVGQPAVENSPATAVGARDATLHGIVIDPGVSTPSVTIYYGLANGESDPGAWSESVALGTRSGAFSATVTDLLPNRTYFFTSRATNTAGAIWANPVLNFTTGAALPSIVLTAATDIAAGSATLGADITDTGGDPPLVTVFYGTNDGGTDPAAWSNAVPLGPQGGPVTVPVSGLLESTTYHFTARAANAAGIAWAPSSAMFTTAEATLPAVTNTPATQINGFSAKLSGTVTDTGNDPPVVTLFFGTSDGGTDPTSWDASVDIGVQADSYQYIADQLAPLTTHYFTARAANAAGTTWAPASGNFTTTAFVPAPVYLNEFLPDTNRDRDGLRPNLPYCDEDGDPEDWIELSNPGASAVDIGGYYLTDNPGVLTKWRFPVPTTIPAGSYLVVFASNKNRAVPGAELHTNFRLDPDGEYLALVGADGTSIVQEFGPAYPAIATHFSYGLVPPARGGAYNHFETPTPGAANTTTPGAPSGPVSFDLPSQTFATSIALTLDATSPSAVIRYTTDGSAPTASSAVFTGAGPIVLTSSTQVRARTFETGFAPGPIRSESYLRINPNVSAFTSDLPILILEGFRSGRPNSDTPMHWTIFEPDARSRRSSPASLPDLATRGRMRVRGSSSAGWPKYSLTMEAWNELDEDRDVAPLGLPPESDWVLSGRYEYDRALMRNVLIFGLSNQVGRYAPRTRYVEVFINTGNGRIDYNEDYMGVYALTEKIKRDGARVDVERLTKADLTEPELSGGYMIKMDRNDPGDSGWTTALGIPGTEPFGNEVRLNHVYPKEDDILAPQRDYIRGYINAFEAAINAPGYSHPITGVHYTDYIDVGSWIDHIWLNILAQNPDALRLSTHMFKPRGGKLHAGPIWDFDRSMQSTDGRDNNPRRFSATQPATDLLTWGWWEQLFAEPDFEQAWIDRWAELRDGAFADSNIQGAVDAYAAELAEAQARNFTRWSDKPPRGGSHAAEVAILKDWLTQHTAWIDGRFLPRPVLTPGTGQVTGGAAVAVSVGGRNCYFTTDGSDPRLPGGKVSPSATVLPNGSGIAINTPSEIVIRAYDAGTWGAPKQETYVLHTPASMTNLVVSEIMYHPLDPTADEQAAGFFQASDFEYLEIHNPTASTVSLTGVNISEAFDFAFAGSSIVVLAPGERALVVRNRAAFEARHGTGHPVAGEFGDKTWPDGGRKLSNSGERILVTAADASSIADFSYGDGIPWPDAPDGGGYSLVLKRPQDTPDHGSASNWRSSASIGGNPGTGDAISFAGTVGADDDGNGIDDLLDHALGHPPGATDGLPMTGLVGDAITLSYLENLAADDVAVTVQWSTDLVNWFALGSKFRLESMTPDGTGRQALVYRSVPEMLALGDQFFLRLVGTR